MLWQKTGRGKNLNIVGGGGIEKKSGKIYIPDHDKSCDRKHVKKTK